jgi:hypothetical protein
MPKGGRKKSKLNEGLEVVHSMSEQNLKQNLNVPPDSPIHCNNNVHAEHNDDQDANIVTRVSNVPIKFPNLLPTLQPSLEVVNPMPEQDLNVPPDSIIQYNNNVHAEHNHDQDTNTTGIFDESTGFLDSSTSASPLFNLVHSGGYEDEDNIRRETLLEREVLGTVNHGQDTNTVASVCDMLIEFLELSPQHNSGLDTLCW